MSIQTIHLLHHTHVDFGYTDLPGTMARLQRQYTREALGLIEANRNRDDAACFRWTIEVSEVARDFLGQCSESERVSLLRARDHGFLDVGALPYHPTRFSGYAEWGALEASYAETWDVLKPRVAILNDASGLPWGLVPKLLDRGVQWLSMGINEHKARPPRRRPAFFRWEGTDGRSLLVWLGLHYCAGYFFFHASEWRRGPVPNAADIFFNPPETGDIWRSDPSSLEQAEAILKGKLEELSDYPHAEFALQITNMWRMDNDPPFEGICDFVSAWNASGRSPKLRLSTFEQFFEAASADPTLAEVETLRGDWVNWWADGIASLPRENVAIADAVQRLSDLAGIAEVCNSPIGEITDSLATAAWRGVSLFNEHTCDAYDAMANPSGALSLGHKAAKSSLAFQAQEDARAAASNILRRSPHFIPASRGKGVIVINPGRTVRSGWIQIPADAMRHPVNALKDPATGEVFPLLPSEGPKWSKPILGGSRPYERPNDTFSFFTTSLRAFIPNFDPLSSRNFLLGDFHSTDSSNPSGLDWLWDDSGQIISICEQANKNEWVDANAYLPFGGIIVDIDRSFGARDYLCGLDAGRIRKGREVSVARPRHWECRDTPYGQQQDLELVHPLFHHIEQRWLLHRLVPRLEITTTLWLKEVFDPLVMAMAFPFGPQFSDVSYTSFGVKTRVGQDQMPGCCGDFFLTEGEVSVSDGNKFELVLRCPEVPLAAIGELQVHEGRRSAKPEKPHVFSIFELTHWMTNFSHVLPGKVMLRHVIEPRPSAPDSLYVLPSEAGKFFEGSTQ
jgi:hypothetical protein